MGRSTIRLGFTRRRDGSDCPLMRSSLQARCASQRPHRWLVLRLRVRRRSYPRTRVLDRSSTRCRSARRPTARASPSPPCSGRRGRQDRPCCRPVRRRPAAASSRAASCSRPSWRQAWAMPWSAVGRTKRSPDCLYASTVAANSLIDAALSPSVAPQLADRDVVPTVPAADPGNRGSARLSSRSRAACRGRSNGRQAQGGRGPGSEGTVHPPAGLRRGLPHPWRSRFGLAALGEHEAGLHEHRAELRRRWPEPSSAARAFSTLRSMASMASVCWPCQNAARPRALNANPSGATPACCAEMMLSSANSVARVNSPAVTAAHAAAASGSTRWTPAKLRRAPVRPRTSAMSRRGYPIPWVHEVPRRGGVPAVPRPARPTSRRQRGGSRIRRAVARRWRSDRGRRTYR